MRILCTVSFTGCGKLSSPSIYSVALNPKARERPTSDVLTAGAWNNEHKIDAARSPVLSKDGPYDM